jgi:hypothetical protein
MVGDNGTLQRLGELDNPVNRDLVVIRPLIKPDLGVLLQQAIVLGNESDDLLGIRIEANGNLSSCERVEG